MLFIILFQLLKNIFFYTMHHEEKLEHITAIHLPLTMTADWFAWFFNCIKIIKFSWQNFSIERVQFALKSQKQIIIIYENSHTPFAFENSLHYVPRFGKKTLRAMRQSIFDWQYKGKCQVKLHFAPIELQLTIHNCMWAKMRK